MKEISVPKGERRRVIYIWGSSIPGSVRFTAETKSGNPPSGKVETSIRRWLKFKTTEYLLQPENRLDKGITDASYQIYVTPDQDTTLRFQTRHFEARHLCRSIVVLLGLAVVAGAFPLIIRALRG